MKRILAILPFLSVSFFCVAAFVAHAQDSASITGVVTDTTGALMRGVSTTLSSSTNGVTYSAVTNFVAGYANDAPALLTGSKSAVQEHTHKVGFQVFLFADQTAADNAFTGPVGFQIGARNNLRGPGFFNEDAGLAKGFAIVPDRGANLKFRADAFNVFNHPSFAAPSEASSATDITNSNFGIRSATASRARVMQCALRLEF